MRSPGHLTIFTPYYLGFATCHPVPTDSSETGTPQLYYFATLYYLVLPLGERVLNFRSETHLSNYYRLLLHFYYSTVTTYSSETGPMSPTKYDEFELILDWRKH